MNQLISAKLKQLEETSWDFRNIAHEEGVMLNTLIKTGNYRNVLELGTSNGYSAIWLGEALSYTKGQLITVEIDPERIIKAKQNFMEVKLEGLIEIKEGDSFEVIKTLKNQFDLIFIDGGRDYLEIFKLADKTLLRPKGILAVDNVISHRNEHLSFIKAIENNPNYQNITLPFGGGLLIALKLSQTRDACTSLW